MRVLSRLALATAAAALAPVLAIATAQAAPSQTDREPAAVTAQTAPVDDAVAQQDPFICSVVEGSPFLEDLFGCNEEETPVEEPAGG